jgi:hypothetical protein
MTNSDEPNVIFNQIEKGEHKDEDLMLLRKKISERDPEYLEQLGKYNVSIDKGENIQVGDRTFLTLDDEAMQAIVHVIRQYIKTSNLTKVVSTLSVCTLLILFLLFYMTDPNKIPTEIISSPLNVVHKEIIESPSSLHLLDIKASGRNKALSFDFKASNQGDDAIFLHKLVFSRVPDLIEPSKSI